MKYTLMLSLLLSIGAAICCGGSNDISKFEKNIFVSGADSLPYLLLKPQANIPGEKQKKFPLVIFLHGAGERGNDNVKQVNHIAGLFTSDFALQNYPCYLIAPQCPEKYRWVETDWTLAKHTMPTKPSVPMSMLIKLINDFIESNAVDKNRIYITGLSMGGFGTWDLICREPGLFAAAAPVCGGGDENQAGKIKDIPLWVFHGAKDPLVKVKRSRNMVNALIKTGANPIYTEYQNVGHDAWNKAYANNEILKWMFSQKK